MHIRYLIPILVTAFGMISPAAANSETAMMERKIEAFEALSVGLAGRGGSSFSATLARPRAIAVADKEYGWGWYQFPGIGEWADSTLVLTYSAAPDAAESYGTPRPVLTSRDGGKTWIPHSGRWGDSGLLLPNGDRIGVLTPKPYKVADLNLPEPVGVLMGTYGKQKYVMYRVTDLPRKLQTIRIKRLKKGADRAVTEHAYVDDPQSLRYSLRDVFPIIWWGDLRVAFDGSVIAGIYPASCLRDDGSMDPRRHIFFYRSTDSGRVWKLQGRILYEPDLKDDPNGNKRDGFSEPAFEILADGSLVCVMRTTDGAGIGPMYSSRSTDMGRTWSKPKVIAPNGVLPKLMRLENGVLVLASGRPGVQLRFSTDGDKWTDPIDLVPVTEKDPHKDTCGYTDILATGSDSFLIAYSHFKHKTDKGETRKAILVREVRVDRRQVKE